MTLDNGGKTLADRSHDYFMFSLSLVSLCGFFSPLIIHNVLLSLCIFDIAFPITYVTCPGLCEESQDKVLYVFLKTHLFI